MINETFCQVYKTTICLHEKIQRNQNVAEAVSYKTGLVNQKLHWKLVKQVFLEVLKNSSRRPIHEAHTSSRAVYIVRSVRAMKKLKKNCFGFGAHCTTKLFSIKGSNHFFESTNPFGNFISSVLRV